MFADSQYALFALGGPSIALAVGVLWCILNRQRRKRALRFDAEVERATFATEPSPSTAAAGDLVEVGQPADSESVQSAVQLNNLGIRKRKLYQSTNEEPVLERGPEFLFSPAAQSDGFATSREEEAEAQGTSLEGNFSHASEPLVEPEVPIITTAAIVDIDAEPTLIVPPALSPKASPTLEKHSAEDFWKHCRNDTLCKTCGSTFTVWTRRHHCRKCFASVCASCSPNTASIPGWEDKQRVCNQCWDQLNAVTSSHTDTTTGSERVEAKPEEQDKELEKLADGDIPQPPEAVEEINPMIGQSAFVILGQE